MRDERVRPGAPRRAAAVAERGNAVDLVVGVIRWRTGSRA